MPRGGKRQGAGAPKGNLNALKHGEYSERLFAFIYLLASTPTGRRILTALLQDDTLVVEPLHRTARDMARLVEQDLINVDLRRRIREIVEKDYF